MHDKKQVEDEGKVKEERDQSGCYCIPPRLPDKRSLVLFLACSCAYVSDHVSRGFSMCPSRVRQLNSRTQHRGTRRSRIRRVWSRRWVPGATQVGPQLNDEDSPQRPFSLSLSLILWHIAFSSHLRVRIFCRTPPSLTGSRHSHANWPAVPSL